MRVLYRRGCGLAWASFLTVVVGQSSGAAEIVWRQELEASLEAARSEERPVLVDFWATWCEPCRRMDRELWSRPEVVERVEEFIPVRIDVDRRPDVARRFAIGTLPAVVVADGWAEVIGAIAGYRGPQAYLAMLQAIPADLSPIANWSARLAERPRDLRSLLVIGRFYSRTGLFETSNRYLRRGLENSGPADGELRGELLIGIGLNDLSLGEPRHALKSFKRAYRVGDFSRRDVALLGTLAAQIRLGRSKAAEESHRELARQFPDSPALEMGVAVIGGASGEDLLTEAVQQPR